MLCRENARFRFLLLTFFVLAVPLSAAAQNLIVDGATVSLGGIQRFDHICVINGGVINVTPYSGSGSKVATGNLELIARTIFIEGDSRINARGAGYSTTRCSNGRGPNGVAGGRGGCSVRDSGGGGAHFGLAGRGTIDDPTQYPRDFEDDCMHSFVNGACDSTTGCTSNGGPTVAGQPFWHNIYDPEFGASGGDKGCRDGDGTTGPATVGGPGGGRVVLVGLTDRGTGNAPAICTAQAPGGVIPNGSVIVEGDIDAGGKRGCGYENDSGGGGGGGTVLIVGGNVRIGQNSQISAAGGLGGDTLAGAMASPNSADCPSGSQSSGTCDDCGGGGGGGIISVLSLTSDLHAEADFFVGGGAGGTCGPLACIGESGGGAGELQLDGAYIGEYCDGFDNDFDGMTDEGLGTKTCGLGTCQTNIQSCTAGAPPVCSPTVSGNGCLAPLTDTRPRVSVILDTSASMLLDLEARPTFGDGSADQPSRAGAQQSRMQLARESLAQVMSAYPEIDFSLARYHQDQGLDRSCQSAAWFECQGLVASYDNPTGNTGAQACTALPVSGPLPSGVANVTVNVDAAGDECINYAGSCGAPRRGADILTAFGMPTNDIVRWLDGRESADDVDLAVITPGNVCNHSSGGDCEVRGTGPTPLAGSLLAVQDYVLPIRATDPIRQASNVCRSYDVILVTDGAESCNGAPITAAQQLFAQGIQTYVIAVSVLATEVTQLNQIARAGSGNMRDATFVDNPAQLVPALTSIIADSILSETCNGMDDDCDGAIDEDFPGLGDACNNGQLGECRETGLIECTSATTTACVTPAPATPVTEQCDNDANCVTLCNSLDDDCDGAIDEDLTRECDRGCGVGDEFCADGAWVGCGARAPSDEICNNFDDDCDTNIDEGADGMPLTRPCATACGPGLETCTNGMYPTTGPGSCSAPTSRSEECNNLDDNCNGIIDDGNPGGGERCIPRDDGGYDVVDPNDIDPTVELCNPGTVTCTAGQLRCVGASSRSPEVCNCEDDDCDGEIDEEASDTLCPGDSVCITTEANGSTPMACFCASPCQDSEFGSCPPGRFCDTTYASDTIRGLCLRGMCEGVMCPETSVCDPATGACVDLCDMTNCPGDQTCVLGRCVEANCYGRGCPVGEICEGTCVADPCAGVRCEDNEFCRASSADPSVGECVGACDSCAASQVCINGQCTDDPCGGDCDDGETCVDGECTANVCVPVCGNSRVCHGGTCVHDPCSTADECPTGALCVAVDQGGTLRAQCAAPPLVEVDAGAPVNVLAAGGGGCACTVAGAEPVGSSSSGRGALLISALCIGLLLRRRMRVLRLVTLVATFVLASTVVGCKVDPFCVDNCEGVAGTSAGTGGGGSGGTGGDPDDAGPMRVDANLDGCEPSSEICNGEDDDCDNLIDDGFELMTDPANCGTCNTQCVVPNAFPACIAGECAVDTCEAGFHDRNGTVADGCEYACTESGAEVCDLRDNDCDSDIDEDTVLATDIANCGTCGNVCNYANAAGMCADGSCSMGACVPGFVDLNAQDSDGCELRCTSTPEACNALDDDCDGEVDEELTAPSFCRVVANTPCADVTATCRAGDSGTTWYCDYPNTVDFTPALPNGLALDELRCDGIDNDCDGSTDESFGDVGVPCNDGESGICRGTGTIVCATEQTTECEITSPGMTAAAAESCNGLDDDCDGNVDEGSIDDVIHITHSSMNFYVYRYEASRTDASGNSQGASTARACSKPNVIPWTKLSRDAAQAACVAANMRLCTALEWQTACEGTANRTYTYGNTYNDDACNGADYGTAQGDQAIRATGALSTCVSQDGLRDMSGNAKEWTSQTSGPNYVVRGGSYASPELGLTCLTTLSQATNGTLLDGTGFRCCSNTAP